MHYEERFMDKIKKSNSFVLARELHCSKSENSYISGELGMWDIKFIFMLRGQLLSSKDITPTEGIVQKRVRRSAQYGKTL